MQSEINYLEHTKLLCEDFDMSIIHTTQFQIRSRNPIHPEISCMTYLGDCCKMANKSKIYYVAKSNSPLSPPPTCDSWNAYLNSHWGFPVILTSNHVNEDFESNTQDCCNLIICLLGIINTNFVLIN